MELKKKTLQGNENLHSCVIFSGFINTDECPLLIKQQGIASYPFTTPFRRRNPMKRYNMKKSKNPENGD